MSQEVKRYWLNHSAGYDTSQLEEDKEGEYVLFSDYEAKVKELEAELKELKEKPAFNQGYPPSYFNEWFIALTSYRDRVVLKALPKEFSYDFETADETYIMKENIIGWMQFPDSEYKIFKDLQARLDKAIECLEYYASKDNKISVSQIAQEQDPEVGTFVSINDYEYSIDNTYIGYFQGKYARKCLAEITKGEGK